MNYIEDFRAAMLQAGLDCRSDIPSDGRLHRFKPEGDKDACAWFVLFNGDRPAGAFGCWRRQLTQKWHVQGPAIKGADLVEAQKRWREAEAQRAADERDRHQRFSEKVAVYLKTLLPATDDHPYLSSKKVPAIGPLKLNSDNDLVLPLSDETGKVWSYQTIDVVGDKPFMPGGRVKGCFYPLHNRNDSPLVICEGYATGASIHQATNWAVWCAMNCGNLKDVALSARHCFSDRRIVIAADNDRFTEGSNPGIEKAAHAADAVKGLVVIPEFPTTCTTGTDFNDLAQECGSSAVSDRFIGAVSRGLGQRMSIDSLMSFKPSEDKLCILGNRYLCKGGSCVIVGSTSVGKSSLGLQMAVMFAVGANVLGLKPPRPLKSLFIQAENDLGDMAEIIQGILKGNGLIREGCDEANAEILNLLNSNLIIIRDQTHIGVNFSPFVRSLIELHSPDFVWLDPLLSFYGNDVNDQQEMTRFLRSDLNPISESTGVCWMILHHTGKPSKDLAKSQKSWSARDFAYMGIGSSELSNWARAIITLSPTSEDEFRLIFAKRGWRAGICNEAGSPCTELNVAHGGDMIYWKIIPKPKEDDELTAACRMFAQSLDAQPLSATDIVKLAATKLNRGLRTCWSLWDSGNGPLGSAFKEAGHGRWSPVTTESPRVYRDD
jgi:phage/plasmid primase-like uncharacterized protein